MSDRELLEWAAKAAGIPVRWNESPPCTVMTDDFGDAGFWNPLTDNGDALRLAVELGLTINPYKQGVFVSRYEDEEVIAEPFDAPGCNGEATRRAIVRAAASIGQQMATTPPPGQSQENQK